MARTVSGPKKDAFVGLSMPRELRRRIDEWRFERKIMSRSEAIRKMVELVMDAEPMKLAGDLFLEKWPPEHVKLDMNGHNLTIVPRMTSFLVDEDAQTIHLTRDTVLDEQPPENMKICLNGYRLHIEGPVDLELLNKQLEIGEE